MTFKKKDVPLLQSCFDHNYVLYFVAAHHVYFIQINLFDRCNAHVTLQYIQFVCKSESDHSRKVKNMLPRFDVSGGGWVGKEVNVILTLRVAT